jgi:hypothetical protein
MNELVADDPTPEEAESRLIAYCHDERNLTFLIQRLRRFDAMRCRFDLLAKAQAVYGDGRYYAVAHVLISVMDGFVNDLVPSERRNLSARDPEELVGWDTVTAHHMGLSHAHGAYTKTFRATHTSEVVDLHRHGIVHGTVINYDNVTVATKAWNMLFAVADWADAEISPPSPKPANPTWRQIAQQLTERRVRRAHLDAWTPSECSATEAEAANDAVWMASRALMEGWLNERWDAVGKSWIRGPADRGATVGKMAGEAKDLFAFHDLTSYGLTRVRRVAPAVTEVDGLAKVNGGSHVLLLRWVRVDPNSGDAWIGAEGGEWRLAPYGPTMLLKGSHDDGEILFEG